MPDTKKKDAKKNNSKPVKPEAPMTSEAAFNACKAEMEALDPAEFVAINMDIPLAVSQSLGVIPNLAGYRGQVAEGLPNHDIASFDKLQMYTLAVYYAHILWLPAETSENRVMTLLEEANPLRGNLLADAEALARRGLLDADVVAQIRAGQGNVDTANDLVALSALFGSRWGDIENKTATTLDEVKRAGELGPLLLAALGVREHGINIAPETAVDQRRRAYTLFVRAYDETRRAIAYLRWHEGDADQIIPSLYKGRGGRPKAEAEAKPADAKPADAKPADGKTADGKTADAKPADAKPADAKPTEAKAADAKPADAKPAAGDK